MTYPPPRFIPLARGMIYHALLSAETWTGQKPSLGRWRATRRQCMNWKLRIVAWTGIFALLAAARALGDNPLTVKNLRCEYKVDPLGIDVRKPRLSWELVSAERGELQTSYGIRVALAAPELAKHKSTGEFGKQSTAAPIPVEDTAPAVLRGK